MPKKRIKEFVDHDHEVMNEFYDITDTKFSKVKWKKAMVDFIQRDPLFFDPYLVLIDIYQASGKDKQAKDLLHDAYEKARVRITDKEGNWPDRMEWGWLENRHIMRVIERYAYELWKSGKTDEALDIFRRLLQANPGDNQGARHAILAILLKLGPDWEEQFMVKTGPMAGQVLEANKLCDWFDRHVKAFPEEFGWWLKAHKE